jgi:hypothetical protein
MHACMHGDEHSTNQKEAQRQRTKHYSYRTAVPSTRTRTRAASCIISLFVSAWAHRYDLSSPDGVTAHCTRKGQSSSSQEWYNVCMHAHHICWPPCTRGPFVHTAQAQAQAVRVCVCVDQAAPNRPCSMHPMTIIGALVHDVLLTRSSANFTSCTMWYSTYVLAYCCLSLSWRCQIIASTELLIRNDSGRVEGLRPSHGYHL